jgi:hypothetical protein
MTANVYTWSWRGQPPLDQIIAQVDVLRTQGRPVFMQTAETETDEYALVVSDVELTAGQATQMYDTPDAVIKVTVTIEPRWADTYTEVVDVALAEVIGLEGMARETRITEILSDWVNDVCSWGHTEGETVDFPDEDEGPQE